MPRRSRPPADAPAFASAGEAPLSTLPGVGPALVQKFAARGLLCVQDLWLHLPLRYEDRTKLTALGELVPGQPAQVEGRVEAVERGFKWRPMLRVMLTEPPRHTLALRFFHFNAAQAAQFLPGRRVRVFGEPRPGARGLEMVHPSYRFLGEDDDRQLHEALDPVYPAVEGIGAQSVVRLVGEALKRLPGDEELELLPPELRQGLGMPSLREALLTAHRPPADSAVEAFLSGRHPALQRLALEELLAQNLSLRRQRIALRAHGADPIPRVDGGLGARLCAALGYALTGAQQRVYAEIGADMAQPAPMLRLLQGDVGSGKTVVAALAALSAVAAGKQVALMAPTELLAEQHLASFRAWFEPLGLRVAWLAGKVGGRARVAALAEIADGSAQIVVGTHALMQEGVRFHSLGLVVIDEQHRFGVHQRLALR
ncbi:MAG: DEAD/DEAH box helicase, partial [Arenimonas sp.]